MYVRTSFVHACVLGWNMLMSPVPVQITPTQSSESHLHDGIVWLLDSAHIRVSGITSENGDIYTH